MIVTNLQTLVVTFTANVNPYIQGIRSILSSNASVNSMVSSTVAGLANAAQASARVVSSVATSAWGLMRATAGSIANIGASIARTLAGYGPMLTSFFTRVGIQSNRAFSRMSAYASTAFRATSNAITTASSVILPTLGRIAGGVMTFGSSVLRLGVSTAQVFGRIYSGMASVASVSFRGIQAGIAGISTLAHNAVRSVEMFGASWVNAGKHIRAAGKLMSLYITAPLALIGGMSVTAFAKFDQAMTETFARMGRQSAEVRDQMESLAMSLSTKGTVAFSPIELAKGYTELGAAGLNAAQSMSVIEDVAILAQAGMFDIDVAVKQLVGSMASFGAMSNDPAIFSTNLKRFSDVMVSVANTTTTGVEEVARAMSADGAVAARNYGMSIEELGAILGVYAMQNKDAEEAGHLTGRAIRLLTSSFQRHGDVWKKFGIDLVDKSTGQYVKFSSAIKMIEKAMGGMSGPMRTAFLDLLGFETLAQKSILPLIGQSAELERQEQLYKQVGSAQEMATIQMESFSNQMKILWNVMRIVGIEVGKILAPVIKMVVKYVADGIAAWRNMSKEMKTVSIAVLGIVAGIGPAVVALSIFTSLIGYAAIGAAWILTSMAAAVAGFAKAFIIVGVIGYTLYKVIDELVQRAGGLTSVWDNFKSASLQMYNTVAPIFVELGLLWEVVTTGFAQAAIWAFDIILSYASGWATSMMAWSGMTWSSAISWIAEWIRFARFAFQNAGMVAAYMFTRFQLFGATFFAEMYHMFTVAIPAVFQWFGENWSDVLHTMFDLATTIFINLVENMGKIFSNLPALLAGTVTFDKLWTPLTEGFVNTIRKLPEIAPRVVGATEQALLDETHNQEAMIAEAYAGMVDTDLIAKQNAKDQKAIADSAAKEAESTGAGIIKSAEDLTKLGGGIPGINSMMEGMIGGAGKKDTATAGGGGTDNVARNSNEALHRIMAYQEAGPGMPYGKTIGLDGSIANPTSRATSASDAALSAQQEKEDLIVVERRIEGLLAKAVGIMLKFQADASKPVDGTLLPADL